MTNIHVNGEEKELRGSTVLDLLAAEEVDTAARFVAVAINGVVVPRGRWKEASVNAGDTVEIVRPAPGG